MKSSSSTIIDAPLINVVNGYDNFAYDDRPDVGSRQQNPRSLSIGSFNSVSEGGVTVHLKVTDGSSKRSSLTRLNAIDMVDFDEAMCIQQEKQLRFICLTRDSPDSNYGFAFKTFNSREKHFITLVTDNTISSEAGLKKGDLLIEVNGEAILELNHKEVSAKMRSDPLKLNLTVINDMNLLFDCLVELDTILRNKGNKRGFLIILIVYKQGCSQDISLPGTHKK